jgi:RND family efflux transporter MFP subunit
VSAPLRRLLLVAAAASSSCSRAPASEPAGAAAPAVQVQVQELAPRTLEETSAYVAALSSRESVTLYPQVSGYVRAIAVRPGAAVVRGQRLLELDATAEQAAVDNLIAARASQASGLALALDRQRRSVALRADGIVSEQAAEEARAQAEQAAAALQATDALLASQRARRGYFSISAPLDGVVGNVPVKVGELVTPATAVTSVSRASALEAWVNVPAERVGELTPDSRVRLLSAQGEVLAEEPLSFVADRVDPATQLVLIKAVFTGLPGLRPEQTVPAQVLWSRRQGLAVPTTAVLRQAGQPFVFVVERQDGRPVARRVPLTLGRLGQGEVVVSAGLDAGAVLVVSGVQQLTDGAAVELKPPQR